MGVTQSILFSLALFCFCSYFIHFFKKSPRAPTLSQWSTSGCTSVFNIRPLASRNHRTHFLYLALAFFLNNLTFTSALGDKEAVMIWSETLSLNKRFPVHCFIFRKLCKDLAPPTGEEVLFIISFLSFQVNPTPETNFSFQEF